MTPAVLGTFVAGLVLLLVGAGFLVRGASRLAAGSGISPLVIGLTVVAWGTGSPELAVGVGAALNGQPDLAVGNVVGSNVANVLLILGLAAVIAPLKVSQRLVRWDVPIMIAVSLLVLVMSLDGNLGVLDGALLVTALIVYTWWSIRESRRTKTSVAKEYEREFGGGEATWRILLLNGTTVAGGLFLLVKGSDWLVVGASAIATALGMSQLIIGLTIVAIGTSLPEVATSAVASFRGERDIAVGNAIGSNIFNILGVLGVTALVAGDGVRVPEPALSLDMPIMVTVAFACMPVFFAGFVIDRWRGGLFLGLYAGYLAYLVLEAMQHAALEGFTSIMVAFVLPLVAFTLLLLLFQGLFRRTPPGIESTEAREFTEEAGPPDVL